MFNRIPNWLKILSWILIAIVITIYPVIIDLWMEHGSDGTYEMIKSIYTVEVPLIYWIFPVVIFIIVVVYIFQKLTQATEEYKQEMNQHGQLILQKYRELREYQFKKTLSLTLEAFCKKHIQVTAAQVYKYNKIPKRKSVTVKLNYIDGFVKDQHNLNGMIQKHYEIDKSIYTAYHKSIKKFLRDPEDFNDIVNFIIKYKNHLDDKDIEELDFKDALIYAFIIDAYTLLLKYYPDTRIIYVDSDKQKKLEEFNHNQRTGILRGIELELFYEFKYEGNGDKNGRQYITRPVLLQNDQHILLITVDSDLLPEDQDSKEILFQELMDEFQDMLQQSFESYSS
ncbi:hypothetical protein FORC086_25980 [Bacillus cereus]|uniref:hypothetical protein n=1 Tax=Bacillus cereus TaxID=1396 RepID=UPI00046EDC62|nr:hypothetical protein [Bacillus cereus]QCT47309.1 hypothetical protein FORC086_25980 [Bacillus cereus]